MMIDLAYEEEKKPRLLLEQRKHIWAKMLNYYLGDFLLFFYPELYANINWNKPYHSLSNKLYRMIPANQLCMGYLNTLFSVVLLDDTEQWLTIHVEVDANVRPDDELAMHKHVFIHFCKIYANYGQNIVSIALVLQEQSGKQQFFQEMWGHCTAKDFLQCGMLEYKKQRAELLANENPTAFLLVVQLAAVAAGQDLKQRYEYKKELTIHLLGHTWQRNKKRLLYSFLDNMLPLSGAWEREYVLEFDITAPRFFC
jgi:hypothetical protein